MEETAKGIVLELDDAKIKGISTKEDAFGSVVATIKIEVKSDNPEKDFRGLYDLQKIYLKMTLDGSNPDGKVE